MTDYTLAWPLRSDQDMRPRRIHMVRHTYGFGCEGTTWCGRTATRTWEWKRAKRLPDFGPQSEGCRPCLRSWGNWFSKNKWATP